MPRIRQKDDVYRNADFRAEVARQLKLQDLQQHDLAVYLELSDGAVSQMLKSPEKISMERLRKIIVFLELEPETVLRFAGYKTKEIKEAVTA